MAVTGGCRRVLYIHSTYFNIILPVKKSYALLWGECGCQCELSYHLIGEIVVHARLELIQSSFFMSIFVPLWDKSFFSVGCRSPPLQKEFSDLTDETLNRRARHTPKSVEETVTDMERSAALAQAIAELPEIQRRRFVLYYEYDLTFRAIGELEGCTATSVKKSVDIAKAKIKKKLENF